MNDVEAVLKCLEEANLMVKPSKCKFALDQVRFLRHEVRSEKKTLSQVKIHAIKNVAIPTTKTQSIIPGRLLFQVYKELCKNSTTVEKCIKR